MQIIFGPNAIPVIFVAQYSKLERPCMFKIHQYFFIQHCCRLQCSYKIINTIHANKLAYLAVYSFTSRFRHIIMSRVKLTTVKPPSTEHSRSLKLLCPIFGDVRYSEGLDWGQFVVSSKEKCYWEVSVRGGFAVLQQSNVYNYSFNIFIFATHQFIPHS